MGFVVCVVKSAVVFVVAVVVFTVVGLAVPEELWWGYVMTAVVFGCLITWNILTTRWALAAHTGTRPAPWVGDWAGGLPGWVLALFGVLACPPLLAAGLIAHHGGVGLAVLLGGPATLGAVLWLVHRHRVRRRR